MPRLTLHQRVWICIEFSKCSNAREVIRRWPNRWPNDRPHTDKTVKQTFHKFEAEATCHNLNKGQSGRSRTAIQNASNNLDPAMIRNAFNGMVNCVNKCSLVNGKSICR